MRTDQTDAPQKAEQRRCRRTPRYRSIMDWGVVLGIISVVIGLPSLLVTLSQWSRRRREGAAQSKEQVMNLGRNLAHYPSRYVAEYLRYMYRHLVNLIYGCFMVIIGTLLSILAVMNIAPIANNAAGLSAAITGVVLLLFGWVQIALAMGNKRMLFLQRGYEEGLRALGQEAKEFLDKETARKEAALQTKNDAKGEE